MSHAIQGHARWMGHSEEFWQNVVHWRKERQTTPEFLLWEPNEQYEKANRFDTGRWTLHRSEGVQCVTGQEQRAITNSYRKNEKVKPKQKWHSVVNMSGGESKVWSCKEQYCIGTWNVRSMNQGKLDKVKQEMARVNIDILGISEVKWMVMSESNSDDHYIYYCGQESLRRNGVPIEVNKRVQNAVLGCKLKNDITISNCFQGNHSTSQ